MAEDSLTAVLQERASRQPDATAYTFIDYQIDPNGFSESLTWAQVQRRARVVADELRACGATGDRAAILAPQGLDYIVAFLGALQAGFIAVPLSVPQSGVHDERISSALRDCSPTVILTTSSCSAAGDIAPYAQREGNKPAPEVLEVDLLDVDSPHDLGPVRPAVPRTAYLQYTSGSTRRPAGVIVTHTNVITDIQQAFSDYLGGVMPPDFVLVSWLPFFHDMGLIKGICAPLVCGRRAVLMSPMSFLQRPARWMQALATSNKAFSAAPNFAFELTAKRTTDADLAGLDLGEVIGIASGSERVHAATLRAFTERFARFNLKPSVVRPSYGLAEATVYVATADRGHPAQLVRFDYEKLSKGHARPCRSEAVGSTELVGHGTSRSTTVRIVDPEARTENPAGKVGEIWVHGQNVSPGYWHNPRETERTFGARLVNPASATPGGGWLRTGDLGVISEGELFIIGRIKDLLIVDGSNHYPDDIEASIQELTRGRVAAISVPDGRTEHLVTIVEVKQRGDSADEHQQKLRALKRAVISAVAHIHRVRVADVVFVAPGAIPITTSGKIRRSACVEGYRAGQFDRLDVTP
ncbi:AMP-binding protein [Mycobacterium talmoniae]|uniref:Acyl-CoA synthetase n=1 Tax=Mycobacterium talmoniae TaxID=1858794 RepID=A0A1S1N936_9MYCO|nr:AMP-binding protein [Mycobacterium talmoniae]OHU97952.1 acyl-CoA synthetase [Mycobacterium talmoniae]